MVQIMGNYTLKLTGIVPCLYLYIIFQNLSLNLGEALKGLQKFTHRFYSRCCATVQFGQIR